MKKRRESREDVFELLFEWSFKEPESLEGILENAKYARELEIDDFAKSLVSSTISNREVIDETIEKYSTKWKLNRISSVALAGLRMSISELMFFPDIPSGVAINEAVELVKTFGTEEEASYINGVLGSYVTENRQNQ